MRRSKVSAGAMLGSLLVCLGLAAVRVHAAQKPPEYRRIGEIAVGGDTGWDYLSIDPDARRLYVTHGSHIVVIDLDAGRTVGDIPDTPGVHGFAIARDLGRGFSSTGVCCACSVLLCAKNLILSGIGIDGIVSAFD